MGAKFSGTFDPEEYMAKIRSEVFTAMNEVIAKAVETMKRITETRRNVITGDMLAAIGGDVFFEGVNEIVGRFGFTNNQQLYYILQSGNEPSGDITGFHHYPDGKFIEADFAMRDAYIEAIALLLERLKETL